MGIRKSFENIKNRNHEKRQAEQKAVDENIKRHSKENDEIKKRNAERLKKEPIKGLFKQEKDAITKKEGDKVRGEIKSAARATGNILKGAAILPGSMAKSLTKKKGK